MADDLTLYRRAQQRHRRGRIERWLHSSRVAWIAAIAAAVVALLLYYVPLVAPGAGPFLDSVEYQTTVATGGLSHPPGYPLYLLLGRLFVKLPFDALGIGGANGDNLAWRLNLLSALAASLSVMLTVRLTYRLTGSVVAALVGGFALAGAVRFWFQATYSELYPLYTLFVLATILLLIAWAQTGRIGYYYGSVLVFALSFALNIPALVLIPAWLWFVLTAKPSPLTNIRSLLISVALVILAASLYLYVPLRALYVGPPRFCNYCPADWSEVFGFWSGARWRELNLAFGVEPRFYLQRWADSGYELMLNFWPLGVLLGALGLWHLLQTRWRSGSLLLLALAGSWYFVVSYNVVDWADFMTPLLVLYAPLIGVGYWQVWEWAKRSSRAWSTARRSTLRPLLLGLIVVVPFALTVATYFNNRPIVDESNGDFNWHWTARQLLDQVEAEPLLLVPFPASSQFGQAWAIRFVAWTEYPDSELTLIWPPIDEAPPGPAPGYVRWDAVQNDLAQNAVYVLDAADSRVEGLALLPLLREDGWPIAYRIVGRQQDGAIESWLTPEVWQTIDQSQLLLP